jgi:predicted DNA-binding protein (UPF0251 family)/predicted Fe-Mo cluster-binding NifX family protein
MARPKNCRAVGGEPAQFCYKPAGIPAADLEEVVLFLDEYEALRLADYEGLQQEEAASRLEVSRQTFGRIVTSARKKIADVLVNGKALRIVGGPVRIEYKGVRCMKIALPSRDGRIDAHFGHCAYFTVYTAEDGKIVAEERVDSPEGCGCKSNVASVLAAKGVTLMLAGNMGDGAVRVLSGQGIQTVRGCEGDVRGVAEAWLAGKILDSGESCASHGTGHSHDDGHVCAHRG